MLEGITTINFDIAGTRRLVLGANQSSSITDFLRENHLGQFFNNLYILDIIGLRKSQPTLFDHIPGLPHDTAPAGDLM